MYAYLVIDFLYDMSSYFKLDIKTNTSVESNTATVLDRSNHEAGLDKSDMPRDTDR